VEPRPAIAPNDEGHPIWSLAFMVDGKKRVERIPQEWVEQIRPLVEQGREFKDAVAEVSPPMPNY
jgi:hypothetical protein